MPQFDRVDGVFTTRLPNGKSGCSYAERLIFKRNGWVFDKTTKAWTTANEDKARDLYEYAIGAALEYLDNAEAIAAEIVAASWAEDTDAEFPAPDGLNYLPFQRAGIEYAVKHNKTLVADPPGLGKSSPTDEPVLTPTGWRTVGELVVGDQVIGSSGKPTKVTGVFPQGVLKTYKVTFRDGSWSRCNNEHLWAVRDSNRRKRHQGFTVKSLKELMNRGLKTSDGKNKWDIPLVTPVEFTEKDFFIGPYTLGVLLGDGALKECSPVFSCPKGSEHTASRVESELRLDFRLKKYANPNYCTRYAISRNYKNPHSEYVAELSRLGLRCGSYDKHIPEEYFTGSTQQRLSLLQGLMDTNGSATKNRITFHSTCQRLAEDVQRIVWSLGGSANVRIYDRTHEGKPVEYQVNVKLNDLCPFSLPRKIEQWWPSHKNGPKRFIQSVELCGEHEHVCISVEAEDRLYVTRDYTVTHNTIQAIGVHNVVAASKVLVICPASLKINWMREWIKWDVHGKTVGIAESVVKRKHVLDDNGERVRDENNKLVYRTWTEHFWPDTDVVIINYDMLDPFDDKIKSITWDLMIADECHLLKTSGALRTQCVFGGQRPAKRKNGIKVRDAKTYEEICANRILFLTGTPILSRPIELWNLIRACDPKGLGSSWENYAYTYCDAEDGHFGIDASGASNLEELSRILRERFMIRRDKRAVLKELPDKTREPIILPQDKLEAPVKKEKTRVESALAQYENMLGIEDDSPFRYITMMEGLSERIAEALEKQDSEEPDLDRAVKTLSAPDQLLFTEMSAAREEVALAKVGMVADHITKLIACDEPVIAFAYHKSVISELKKRLEKAGLRVAVITGDVSTKKRQARVDGFQAGEYDVIIGNILAMGVGWTLTRARFVVFAELDWVPALMEQAEDRAWRHGQKNAVIAQYLLVDGSIEAYMAVAILEKMSIIVQALDS